MAASLPAVALGVLAAGVLLSLVVARLAGDPARGWRDAGLALVAMGAGALAVAGWLAMRREITEPLARLDELAATVGPEGPEGDPASLVDAMETLAAEVEHSRLALEIVRRSPDITVTLDRDGHILHATPAADSMLGRPAAWLTGRLLAGLAHPEDRDQLDALRAREPGSDARQVDEIRFSHLHGHWVPTEVTMIDLDTADARVLAIRDVSERKAHEAALLQQALYDPLTGLANRTLFREHVGKALARLRRSPARPHAVLFVDLDGFKTVNDSLGHAAGDEVLAEVGRRLLRWLRPDDTAARLGGDEFAVLLENTSQLDTGVLASRILDVLVTPIVVQGKEVVLSGSIGIALSEPGQDADALLRNADAAMYTAKAAGKGQFRVFEAAMHTAALRRLDLDADLRRAVGRKELTLAYQPIIDLATGELTGAEVLARWRHPERGMIPPLDFIAVAEESGYIRELGRHILTEACRQAREWHQRRPGSEPLRLCVNTSVRQIEHGGFFDQVALVLDDTGMDGRLLTLEITESLFMSDFGATVQKLRRLKELGIKLAVDDFGTGYSSLSYLRSLPIDVLKIDKSFVVGVTQGAEHSAVARAVVKLARTFNLRTVAEGIERPEQAEELYAMGADMGQGYLFSHPLPAPAMEAYLAEHPVAVRRPPTLPFSPSPAGIWPR
ncbi:MAG TPA: EAL domain-containing protein [Acidimicrobiales bacterium]|nr:EAL domain-containing protein [Acidimicrobiales bacterium]